MFEEVNTGNNLPAQIDIYAEPTATPTNSCSSPRAAARPTRRFLYQQTPAVLNPAALLKFLDDQIRTLGTAACPPYHLAIVIGGTSAEMNLKTVKLASTRYLDDLPSEGNDKSAWPIRDREMEQKVLELTRQMGIGAQFGGKYFCHDVRVIRLPRHGASVPIGIGVSLLGRPPGHGQDHHGRRLPRAARDQPGAVPAGDRAAAALGGDVVSIDLNRPMARHRCRRSTKLSGEDAR